MENNEESRIVEVLRDIQDIARIGYWELDHISNTLTWSDGIYSIFEINKNEFTASYKSFLNLVHPDDRDIVDSLYKKSLKTGKPYKIEHRILTSESMEKWVSEIGRTEYSPEGIPLQSSGTVQDITERKSAECQMEELVKELGENERSKTVLLSNLPGMAYRCLYDKHWTMLFASEGCFELTGYHSEDLLYNRKTTFNDIILPEYREHLQEAWINAVEKNQCILEEYRITTRDNMEKWVWEKGIPLYSSNGEVEALEGIVIDITDRKAAELEREEMFAERERLQKQFEQAQKMESVGRLAGGVAHDFNNMLGVILGHTELAAQTLEPQDPLAGSLGEIRKAAEQSANLTRQLLAFARKQTIAPKILDLNGIVKSMLKMLKRLIGENIDLKWLPAGDLKPVKMDPTQIDQILANLCVNARDAIKDVGKITIETKSVVFDREYCNNHPGFIPGSFIMLAVSDNGCGMDKETQSKLFEPFFTTKEAGKGTGLGLATIYGIIKQNNGFINVYSEPGSGTTIKTYLPEYSADRVMVNTIGSLKKAEQGVETILVVEDEKAILDMTVIMLERLGYTVLKASSPAEALQLAEADSSLELLLTDVVMPGMNGRELAEKILKINPGVKRLFMSGYTANVIAHQGVLDTGVNFLQKPFSMSELSAKVRKALES